MAVNINDRPRETGCPGCGVTVLAALRDGLYEAVYVDPVNLSTLGELQALTSSRRTFDHWGGPNGGLDQRRPASIAAHPAGDPSHPIRPEHRCGADPPDRLPDLRSVHYDSPPF